LVGVALAKEKDELLDDEERVKDVDAFAAVGTEEALESLDGDKNPNPLPLPNRPLPPPVGAILSAGAGSVLFVESPSSGTSSSSTGESSNESRLFCSAECRVSNVSAL
jgi:hypothetical protein